MLISIKPVVSRHDCVSKPCSASKAPAAASSCTFKVRLYRAIVLGNPLSKCLSGLVQSWPGPGWPPGARCRRGSQGQTQAPPSSESIMTGAFCTGTGNPEGRALRACGCRQDGPPGQEGFSRREGAREA